MPIFSKRPKWYQMLVLRKFSIRKFVAQVFPNSPIWSHWRKYSSLLATASSRRWKGGESSALNSRIRCFYQVGDLINEYLYYQHDCHHEFPMITSTIVRLFQVLLPSANGQVSLVSTRNAIVLRPLPRVHLCTSNCLRFLNFIFL